jgi:hypothetical protein
MMRTLLKLAVVALLANAAWHLFGAYYPNYKLQDAVEYAAQNGAALTPETLRDRVVELSSQFDVPLTEDQVTVARQNTHTIVDLSYKRPIELVPGFRYQWPFSIHVDVVILGSLK